MAFIGASRVKLRHLAEQGHAGAQRYLEALARPQPFLSALMTGVTLSQIVAASAVTYALLPGLGIAAPLVATLGLTPIMVLVGEIIPKAIARERATRLILLLQRLLAGVTALLAPLVALATLIVRGLLRPFGLISTDARTFVSREELKLLLQLEPGEAEVSVQEAEMIDKILDLGETVVREIMVPLVEVAAIPDTATPAEAVELMQQRGFSRLPIFRQGATDLVGIVTAMDMFHRGTGARTVVELMRPAVYVPESKRIDDLLREMQRSRQHLVVVVDEYGGSTGIVTLEDIVEQIVGEIQDEHDRPPTAVDRLLDGSYRVGARTSIDELNESLGWNLPKRNFETLAGLVLATLHRIPRVGEQFHVDGYTVTVLEADPRRVIAVKISRPMTPTEGG
jgi:CBS domain containing-hemolysin-like protein